LAVSLIVRLRAIRTLPLVAAAATAVALSHAATSAVASTNQLAMFQENAVTVDSAGVLAQLRSLGAGIVRVYVPWNSIAPNSNSRTMTKVFSAGDPASYPTTSWAPYDTIVRDAQRDGIRLNFLRSGGAPLWATASGEPRGGPPDWKPSASLYGAFVHAIATRYSGNYTPAGSSSPLPGVHFWELWNEPNFGPDLAPQASDKSRVATAPAVYRRLVGYGWAALQHTGHRGDTIVIGSLAPRGNSGPVSRFAPQGYPGYFSTTKPVTFTRYLYCVDASYRPLRRTAASAVGCPATAAVSRRFRASNPALFNASGFAIHPYPFNTAPTWPFERDSNDIEFSRISRFESMLDRLTHTYGSSRRLSIYNTEYGYITDPPITAVVNKSGTIGHYVSPATAARYLNWAEYLSWRNPRMASTMQYLLYDADTRSSNFATGLVLPGGRRKATYDAYRMPIFLPASSTRRGRSLLIWGDARPAPYAQADTGSAQSVEIQYRRGSKGSFQTIETVKVTNPRGYFTARVAFPASGTLRLAWTYPAHDQLFPASVQGMTVYSRQAHVAVR
jgi:hypothetical protein